MSTDQGEYHDEDTLRKVFEALESVTGSEVAADDCLHAMQNAGILFRERRTVQGEPSGIAALEAFLGKLAGSGAYTLNFGSANELFEDIVRGLRRDIEALRAAGSVSVQGEPEPSAEEWADRIRAARERAVAKGYTPEHDAQHGVRHLLSWAIDYARRGRPEDSSGLIAAAIELAEIAYAELERLRHVADTMRVVSEALRTRYASDSQAAYFMRQINEALAALPEPQGEPEWEARARRAEDAITEALMPVSIRRPNGSLYRPRHIRSQILGDEDEISRIVVFGTHDLHDARATAARDLAAACDAYSYAYVLAPSDPGKRVWLRRRLSGWFEGMPWYTFETDEERGAAGVEFEVVSEFEDEEIARSPEQNTALSLCVDLPSARGPVCEQPECAWCTETRILTQTPDQSIGGRDE